MSILGLRRTREELIANFGTISGVWLEDGKLINITVFAEKPNLEYAKQHLKVPELVEDEFLTVFGQYIIMPEIFGIFETNISNNILEHGEVQLTNTLDQLRKERGY